jgi:hypothetical protein
VIFALGSAASTRRGRAALTTDAAASDFKKDLRCMAHLMETVYSIRARPPMPARAASTSSYNDRFN